jgi:hypothetical protein
MKLQNIAYVSIATDVLTPSDIDTLLLDSRDYNKEHNVTGVLICHRNTFFQFFEGEPSNVLKVYDRIKKSSKHKNLLELSNTLTDKRYFTSWSMGFCYVPNTEMQALIHAKWISEVKSVQKYASESFGLKMLKDFWSRLSVKDAA